MYYSIALFTERPKAKRPTSTEAANTSYILMSHQSIFTTHTHTPTRALANPTSPSLLLAVLIDRTEVVIIVKPIYPLLLSTKWNLDINNNKLAQISGGN